MSSRTTYSRLVDPAFYKTGQLKPQQVQTLSTYFTKLNFQAQQIVRPMHERCNLSFAAGYRFLHKIVNLLCLRVGFSEQEKKVMTKYNIEYWIEWFEKYGNELIEMEAEDIARKSFLAGYEVAQPRLHKNRNICPQEDQNIIDNNNPIKKESEL